MKQSKLAYKDNNKPSQGTNKPVVRDSNWFSVSALTRLIILAIFMMPVFLCNIDVSATGGSMTVTISDTTVDLNVSPNTNGTFAKSDATTIGVSTTNATGYTLSISANSSSSSNPTSLINNTDNTKMFPSIQSAITEEQFKSLNPSSMAYNNMWGYLPSKHCSNSTSSSCAVNTDFLPSPNISGDILDITSSANPVDPNNSNSRVVNEYELTVGARVDTTATLGTYSNVFVVDVVANTVSYTIVYDDNVVGDMPTDTSGTTDQSSIPLSSNTPKRQGYTFLGWCSVAPTNVDGTDSCIGGNTYPVSGTLPIDQTGGSNNNHLYAMWRLNTIANSTYLQDVGGCPDTLTPGTNYTLKDKRDNQDYTVAKLADGKCWMTKNLNIAGGTALYSDTSDVAPGYPSSGSIAYYILPTSSTTGFSGDTTAYVYNSGNNADNYCTSAQPCYSYYSWLAATANSGLSIVTNDTDAPYSICPKGWKLPTSRGDITSVANSDVWRLAVAYGMTYSVLFENVGTFYSNTGPNTAVPKFLPTGFYGNSTFQNAGNGWHIWSSTSGSVDTDARRLYSERYHVNTFANDPRRFGFGVRCVLR